MSAIAPRRLAGQPAAPGIVFGQIIELDEGLAANHSADVPQMSLPAAMTQAIEQLQDLIARTIDADARTILEFQIEFLRDPELIAQMAKLNLPIEHMDAPAFKTFLVKEEQRLGAVIQKIGKVD